MLGFYRPCLETAQRYDRAVGYFRSSIFAIVGKPFVQFALNGGKARFICSPSVTEEDALAIKSGYLQRQEVLEKSLAKDLSDLLKDETLKTRTELLATLIKCGNLDIRLALRTSGNGIYHEKIGIFQDSHGHRVSFLGSANETWSAWHAEGNHESIEVFRDWTGVGEMSRVTSHANDFERLWTGNATGVHTIEFPEAEKQKLLNHARTDLDGDWEPPSEITSKRRTLLPHQANAIAAWEAAGKRGVFEHATGSGKTFTAIEAIKRHLKSGEPAIVLVPSQLLLEQWNSEIQDEIPDSTVLLAGAGHSKWKTGGRLRSHTSPGLDMKSVVIATMQTAATDTFINMVYQGDHLLIVADEIHQIGSPFNSRSLTIQTGSSLGLSATPNRYGDTEGTTRIFDRYGPLLPPAITLQDAIESGRLVSYEYFPHAVNLTEDEAIEWRKITKQISFELAIHHSKENRSPGLTDKAKMLLIKRSRIAKKARVKTGLATEIIRRQYEVGQSWLVYCEDSDQLNEMLQKLKGVGLKPLQYHSNMVGDKVETLNWFKAFGGVLVSIKCLDEGIDIPAISHAFILASSQNPRQFIQRRGRVLRKSEGKSLAVIHDAIVVPVNADEESDQISLLKAELLRALEFADHALNRGAGADLRRIAIDMGIDVSHQSDAAIEEEENYE
jgi:superfamily II DNA or RNA helicase